MNNKSFSYPSPNKINKEIYIRILIYIYIYNLLDVSTNEHFEHETFKKGMSKSIQASLWSMHGTDGSYHPINIICQKLGAACSGNSLPSSSMCR